MDGRFKLVIHEPKGGDVQRELFDLQADHAEKSNLFEQHRSRAAALETRLHAWQQSVLRSLTGADYAR